MTSPMEFGQTLRIFSELALYETDPAAAALLPSAFCAEKNVVILGRLPADPRAPLSVGMVDVRDGATLTDLAGRLNRPLRPVQLNRFEIRRAISRIYGLTLGEGDDGIEGLALDAGRRIEFSPDQPPSKILDDLLSAAVRRRATDVHIETYADDVDLRFRVDGVLYQITTPLSPENVVRIVSRIKVLCTLDLVERRRAQDGRFTAAFREGDRVRRVDFRVSVVPGPGTEDVVIRILDPDRFILDLDRLSMEPSLLARYRRLIGYPGGMILVTGPTGSGKTSTLYATIQTLGNSTRKILTVEDPIEYVFAKINQKNVNDFMGFADYLRSFLRQNPDVILVGEIRDPETAEVAVRAATTGHLVLSTLHTRDVVGAVARLRVLGVADDTIADTLVGVLGQRLLRRVCEACRAEAPAPAAAIPLFFESPPPGPWFAGRGCEACVNTGYRGMVAVHELLQPDEAFAAAVGEGATVERLREIALKRGGEPLIEDALRKARRGVTTLEEVARRLPPKFPFAAGATA